MWSWRRRLLLAPCAGFMEANSLFFPSGLDPQFANLFLSYSFPGKLQSWATFGHVAGFALEPANILWPCLVVFCYLKYS